ncbi:hypothetical protein [Hasllibacter sp. MH4015]|uniref:DUF7678 domain-containing protein n=1 Tax=Hasllibacter sp. MH4015 TaxID=2854029 RepID=UPI001CD24528|nr:hypothetical protein [Hasllibacter sp. MH4015]
MSNDRDDSKDAFNSITNPDGSPLRDKDNDAPQFKPQMRYTQPAPNLAPGGAMGLRTGLGQSREQQDDRPPLDPEAKLTFTSAITVDPQRYYTGDMPTMPGYSFLARVNDTPTPYGLDEGRIEQLVLKFEDETVARYNHGKWIGEDGHGHEEALHELRGALEPERELPPREKDLIPEDDRAIHSDPIQEAGIATDHGEPDSPWIDGRVTSMPGYTFQAKVFDEPSPHGIDGGKISKLDIRKDGEMVAHYDRGWDIAPQDTEMREALQRIRNGLDDTPQQSFKGFDKGQDKTQGMER